MIEKYYGLRELAKTSFSHRYCKSSSLQTLNIFYGMMIEAIIIVFFILFFINLSESPCFLHFFALFVYLFALFIRIVSLIVFFTFPNLHVFFIYLDCFTLQKSNTIMFPWSIFLLLYNAIYKYWNKLQFTTSLLTNLSMNEVRSIISESRIAIWSKVRCAVFFIFQYRIFENGYFVFLLSRINLSDINHKTEVYFYSFIYYNVLFRVSTAVDC